MDYLKVRCDRARVEPGYYKEMIVPVLEKHDFLSRHYFDPDSGRNLTLASMVADKPPADYFKRVDTKNDISEFLFLRGVGDKPGTHYVPVPNNEAKDFENAVSTEGIRTSAMFGMVGGMFTDLGLMGLLMHYGDNLNDIKISDPLAGLYGFGMMLAIVTPIFGGIYIGKKIARNKRLREINELFSKHSNEIISAESNYDYNVIKQVI